MSEQDKSSNVLLKELEELRHAYRELKTTYDDAIEEHHRIEAYFKSSEALLTKAEEIAKFGNWSAFLSENTIKFSEGSAKIYGFDTNEEALDKVQRLVLPTYRAKLDKALSNLMHNDTPYNVEFKIKREIDGKIMDIHSVAEYDAEKNMVFGTINDITERKNAEIEQLRTQRLLEDSQRIGNIGGWEMRLDTQELKWTKEMYAIHEVDETFKPILDKRVSFYTPESLTKVDAAVHQILAHGGTYELDCEIITAKGNRRTIKTIGMTDLENERLYGLFQDITIQKQSEEALRKSETMLKELNATKDKFFSIIAHDLKTPLSGILGFSEMLRKEAPDLEIDTIVKYSDIIHSSAQQTFGLLENLLEWSKTQQDGIHFDPKKTLLNNLIANEIEGLKGFADQKNISIDFKTDDEMIVTADEKMLCTVIRNLLSNAIKFTTKYGFVQIEVVRNDQEVEVSILDTGVGMEKDSVDKLFKIESSFSSRGTENEKGSGIGLLLCKEFIEKHGGVIWCNSEKGKGSRFAFSIPITSDSDTLSV